MPETGLATTELSRIEQFNAKLTEIVAAADMQVTDQASLVESGNAKISLESYLKSVKSFFDDELGPLEERVKRIKNQRSALESPAKMALNVLVDRQRAWMAEEKRRADAEAKRKQDEITRAQQQKADEDRRAAEKEAADKRRVTVAQINADLKVGLMGKREAAKRLKEAGAEEEAAIQTAAAVAEEEKAKPAPVVRVAPSIPTVAGVRNQTYYYAEIAGDSQDEKISNRYRIIEAFESACAQVGDSRDQARIDFLRRFIMVDEKEIGAYAREIKDDQAVMSAMPGVRAWSKG